MYAIMDYYVLSLRETGRFAQFEEQDPMQSFLMNQSIREGWVRSFASCDFDESKIMFEAD